MRAPLDMPTLLITQLFGGNPAWESFDSTDQQGNPVHVLGHTGIDINAPEGTTALAVWPGTVHRGAQRNQAGNLTGFGLYLTLRTDDGREALYAHLSAYLAADGTRVAGGGAIARTGSTGSSSGGHLHFQIRERNPDYANGYFGCRDPLGGFDHSVIPRLDLSLTNYFGPKPGSTHV